MGTHGLDRDRQGDAQLSGRVVALRAGTSQRQISCVDQQMALASSRSSGCGTFCNRRLALRALGHLSSNGHRSPLDLAREFRDTYVGIAALPYWRHIDEQFLGRDAYLRRGMAQQSPRLTAVCPSWARMVRVRSQLVRNSDVAKPGP